MWGIICGVRIITLATAEEKSRGLQYKRSIEDDTLWVFKGVGEGDYFHSVNVPEPFDIAFIGIYKEVIFVGTMVPEDDVMEVPPGTVMALESKAGNMARWGVVQGSVVSL